MLLQHFFSSEVACFCAGWCKVLWMKTVTDENARPTCARLANKMILWQMQRIKRLTIWFSGNCPLEMWWKSGFSGRVLLFTLPFTVDEGLANDSIIIWEANTTVRNHNGIFDCCGLWFRSKGRKNIACALHAYYPCIMQVFPAGNNSRPKHTIRARILWLLRK